MSAGAVAEADPPGACPFRISQAVLREEATFPIPVVEPESVSAETPRSLRRNARGFPLAFTTIVDEHGVEDPCGNDYFRVQFAYQHRLCGICGEPLPPGELVCFIGSAEQMRNALFYDPAMHPNCARFAFSKCPFLANAAWKPLGRPKMIGKHRPECMYLYWTYDFKRQWIRPLFRRGEYRKLRVMKAGAPVRIERRLNRQH